MQIGQIDRVLPGGAISPLRGETDKTTGKTFSEFLQDALRNVNDLQKQAEQASLNLAAGRVEDIAEVAIAAEKASIALQLTIQVRNKIIDAYQEVMRMQV